MRLPVILMLMVMPVLAYAQDWEDRRLFNPSASGTVLRILSSTDTAVFAPIIEAFVAETPETGVEYLVTSTAEIDRLFRADPGAYDVVVSSAMDLQLKLANDGYALRLNDVAHPDWAQWRQSLFAFTAEPAAIVINRAAFAGRDIPKTRQDLIRQMRDHPEIFRNKIGTYDIRKSGLGYLFATQDARASETYWRLMEVMGGLGAQLYCCSGDMIDDLASGRLVMAYNVLGSYAAARLVPGGALETILPSDFPITMMRTAFVSKDTGASGAATGFVQHLLSGEGGDGGAEAPLPPLDSASQGSTIVLEPALMTFLDTLKRRRFLTEWENAIIQK